MTKFKSVVISSGHGKYVSGAVGLINEVEEARKVVKKVADHLKNLDITVYTFHDDTSKNPSANLSTIVKYHNNRTRDLDISIHFNAFKKVDAPMGCEVLYKTQKDLATQVSKQISVNGQFLNRGAKVRNDLYFLNATNKPSILIEVCFVDSKKDVENYKKNFEAICLSIAETIAGKKLSSVAGLLKPTLKLGSKNESVKELQQYLALNADGIFGPLTEKAVKSFQTKKGLNPDGIVGTLTWKKLLSLS